MIEQDLRAWLASEKAADDAHAEAGGAGQEANDPARVEALSRALRLRQQADCALAAILRKVGSDGAT